ncbi:ribonuclease PH [Vagococcus acidifermentans]|uniref:Multifunctional fusion protein n=1 Tax=Vagococcus acidifermentans TaxID=564710 RepID=A0A430AXR5_9ENTE|nr:ribonuclease PH [Vagococcus acidifermentans]RSU12861.1 ribonuclease PH [Vagococcus acidifermentans]
MTRHDKRETDELRPVTLDVNVLKYPEGSVFIALGETKVICTASIEEKVPPFLANSGTGWVTAEYSMLPRATATRNRRESSRGKLSGRTMEIQRLIGRSLRAVIDLSKLGERAIIIDCDVIQADGGTRTASITGAFAALKLAVDYLLRQGKITEDPIKEWLAAVSVGMLPDGQCVLDLDYEEDVQADVDMNLVMTESGNFVEIQGTGEEATFSNEQLAEMLALGKRGITQLIQKQRQVLQAPAEQPRTAGKELLIATKNPGKAKEFEAIFAAEGYTVKTLLDYPEIAEVEETGTTFEENARLKAETIANQLHQLVLADDSGLQVDALDGDPGVFSARYAGEPKNDAANNAKLLHELTGVPMDKRTARFHCTLALAYPGKDSLIATGELAGLISGIPRGDGGFGYDPLFYLPDEDKTVAEISPVLKNKISHRAKAIQQLSQELKQWLEDETNHEISGSK